MAAFSSIILAGLALGGAIYQGEAQKKAAKQAMREQQKARKQAETEAISQRRRNEMDLNRARQKSPDLLGLLEAEQKAAKAGAASTMLTGRRTGSGLGSSTLLGE